MWGSTLRTHEGSHENRRPADAGKAVGANMLSRIELFPKLFDKESKFLVRCWEPMIRDREVHIFDADLLACFALERETEVLLLRRCQQRDQDINPLAPHGEQFVFQRAISSGPRNNGHRFRYGGFNPIDIHCLPRDSRRTERIDSTGREKFYRTTLNMALSVSLIHRPSSP